MCGLAGVYERAGEAADRSLLLAMAGEGTGTAPIHAVFSPGAPAPGAPGAGATA